MGITSHHQIDRSRVNETAVEVAPFPKSGFNKSYKTYSTFSLGRLHVGGYHHVMPADKFRGSNSASLTFFRLNQPNVSDVNISQHNFFVTLRSLDTSFESAFAPTSNNGMSADWTAPSFSLAEFVNYYLGTVLAQLDFDALELFLKDSSLSPTGTISNTDLTFLTSLTASTTFLANLHTVFSYHYLVDWVDNIYIPRAKAIMSALSSTSDNTTAYRLFIDAFLFPFIGEGSLLDECGYIYVRRSDLHRMIPTFDTVNDFSGLFSRVEQNEYVLRAYYAVWYEYYRDNNLEPKASNLPDWRQFGSTQVVIKHFPMLVNRFRSWTKDVFTTSMPDDIMRHVFAPVMASSSNTVVRVDSDSTDFVNAESYAAPNTLSRNIVSTTLKYRDPLTGNQTSIVCPLPKQVNDVLSDVSGTLTQTAALDLFSLRNAQSLERYLKRNFYFGDEYRDRMLAHYGSLVEDFRINRPEFLSSSISPINPNQVVSSAGTDSTPQGSRNMTITASTSSDEYSFRTTEFGVVLNIISVMPVAQYAGVCSQNMLSHVVDYPIPEFAANNEEFSRVYEMAFSGLHADSERIKPTFGHHPYAHAWRSRVNEVHKEYLSDLQELTFRRLFGMDDDNRVPLLNYEFIHCKPNLGMFAAGHDQLYTPQLYGVINHSFYSETVLPTPVEVI